MPELPEVETVVRGLKHLEGQTLSQIKINDPRVWFESELTHKELRNTKLHKIDRRGKYLLYRFSNCDILQHLRMTGKMLAASSPAIPSNVLKEKTKKVQLRCEFHFAKEVLYFYDIRRFGTLTAVKNWEKYWQQKKLAPDPLLNTKDALSYFLSAVKGKQKPVKTLLMDQTLLLGAGNIYADEVLHQEGIHPEQKSERLKEHDWVKIFQSLINIFENAIQSKGTTVVNYLGADGKAGSYGELLQVYSRENEECLRCGKRSKIKRIILSGRSSHFCPNCQRKK